MTEQEKDQLFRELIAAKLAEGGPFEFDGWNCHDLEDNDCDGWDGEDRRCNCGNRRVYWEQSDDGKSIYAVAW